MARPRVIHDEVKDVHVCMGKKLWLRLSKKAHDERTSISALIREMLEKKFGAATKG